MSESIAARVDDSTAEWLEETAKRKDTTISKLVNTVLEQHIRDIDEPATESGLNPLEERIVEIEKNIELLSKHAEKVEYSVYKNSDICHNIKLTNGTMSFPQLPTNHEGNVHGDDSRRKARENLPQHIVDDLSL
jgi:antitoxin component of RelBE/YafQ-DinJ toxin-antitoxin module